MNLVTVNRLRQFKSDSFTRGRLARFYPAVVIFFSALFLLYKYILQVSPSVMTNDLMRVFHVDGAGLGNLAATFFYAYLVAQLFVGPLLDKYSPRLLTACALALSALGALLFADAHTLLRAELARALVGFGAAFATVSYMKMASVWFRPEKFAFVGGLLATAAMVGALFGEAPLALLVHHAGWRHSLYYCAWLGLGIALLYYLVVRDKKVLANNKQHTYRGVKLKDFVAVLKYKKNWWLTLYSGLAFAPVAVFGGLWGNMFLEETYNLSKTHAASFTSLVFVGLALGGPLLGLLSDRLGKRLVVMGTGTALSLVALLFALYLNHQPLFMLGLWLFLFGFGTGSFMLGFVIGKEFNNVALAATVIAVINTGDALLGAVSEPFVGKLLDTFWGGKMQNGVYHFSVHDFHLALSLLPAYLFGSLLCLRFLKPQKR